MSATNNNNNAHGIEKFEGTFDKEEFGVTIIVNQSIASIRNMESLAIYSYLLTRPKSWKLNVKHLATHFQCNKDKIYKGLNHLLDEKLITCTRRKENGQFTTSHYTVHLSRFSESRNLVDFGIDQPETRASTELSPCLEIPDMVIPDMVIPDAYKTKKLKNKESIENLYVDSSKSTEKVSYKHDALFMYFYNRYPNKQKPQVAYKAFLKLKPDNEFTQMLCIDVTNRINNNWKGRDKSKIPFPATYLNGREWEGEIYENTQPSNNQTKIKTWGEITNDLMQGVF